MLGQGRAAFAAAVCGWLLTVGVAGGATVPSFAVTEPLQFQAAPTVTFNVYASDGEITGVTIMLREFRDPAGRNLSDTVTLTPTEIARLDAYGAPVKIRLPLDAMRSPGDYHVTFVLRGKAVVDGKPQDVAATKSLTINRLKPDITAPALKDVVVVIERGNPFATVEAKVPIRFVNGTAETLSHVGLRGGEIFEDATPAKKLVGGSVRVMHEFGEREPAEGFVLRPDATMLAVKISGLAHAGHFQSRLYVRALAGAQDEIPFRIDVTDTIFWPLMAISFGVVLAFLANFLTSRWRPIEEVKAMALRLRHTLEDLAASVKDQITLDDADELTGEILAAETDAFMDAAGARTRLTALSTRVDDLVRETNKQRHTVMQDLESASAAIDALAARSDLTAAQKTGVEELKTLRASAQADADAKLFIRAAADIVELKKGIAAIAPAPAAANVQGFDEPEGAGGVLPAAPPPQSRITADTTPVAGSRIALTVEGAPDATSYVWTFDDGTRPTRSKERTVNHTFRTAGTFVVRVDAAGDNGVTEAIHSTMIVGASPVAAQLLAIARRVFLADLLLSLIALLISVLTGVLALWASKTFGTAANYLEAIIWGVGVDSSVRGFAAILKKVSG